LKDPKTVFIREKHNYFIRKLEIKNQNTERTTWQKKIKGNHHVRGRHCHQTLGTEPKQAVEDKKKKRKQWK
jgi:hypothetical protein